VNRIIRVPSVCFVVGLLVCPLPAHAQGGGGGGALNLTAIVARVTALETSLAAETAARIAADAGEAAARATADTTLQSNITTEVTNRVGAVAAESSARAAADTTLQGQIDKLNGSITAADFVGDYAVYLVGTALDGNDSGPVEVASYVVAGTATLAENFTGSITAVGNGRFITEQTPGVNWQSGSFVDSPGGGGIAWSYANGILSIVPNPGVEFNDMDLSAAVGAQVLVGVKGGPPSNNQQLIVWTRK
jgi:hypothetical protein